MMPSRSVRDLALLVVAIALAGCGATRSSPDNPLSAGGLTPSLEDKEAGLVAVAPGFAVKGYATLTVARFPVTDKLDDEAIGNLPPRWPRSIGPSWCAASARAGSSSASLRWTGAGISR